LEKEITKDIIGIIEISVSFTAAILTIAFPILLQVIQYFDNKYYSNRIVSLFKKELEYRFFKISLYSTLIFLLVWILIKYYLKNTALDFDNLEVIFIWLLLINTSLLIIIFLMLVNKVFTYMNLKDLTHYIMKRYENI
jgi:hypothetical protein